MAGFVTHVCYRDTTLDYCRGAAASTHYWVTVNWYGAAGLLCCFLLLVWWLSAEARRVQNAA